MLPLEDYCLKIIIKNFVGFYRYAGLHHGSSYLEHLEFLAAIRKKRNQASTASLQEGLISVAMGVAAQLSIETGQSITIKEVLEEKGHEYFSLLNK